jgi:hypothetical protein
MIKFLLVAALTFAPLGLYLLGEPLLLAWLVWLLVTVAVLWFVLRRAPSQMGEEKSSEIYYEAGQLRST